MSHPQNHPALVGAAAHILVADISGAQIELSDDAHRHFLRALRLRAGEVVTVTDGRGAWRRAVVPNTFAAEPLVEPTDAVQVLEPPKNRIALGIAVPKGDKPELVVQKLTELGVDEIVFFHGDHSVARWNADKVLRNLERLRSVATEALQQSRGAFLPTLGWLPDLAGHIRHRNGAGGEAAERRVLRADVGGEAPQLFADQLILVGPEGGWSGREKDLGKAVSLGQSVLRAETAAVIAGGLWVGMRSGLIRQTGPG